MMTIRSGWILLAAIMLVACDARVHDPWVQDDGYLKQERSRSAQQHEQLDRRLHFQADR
ncbi:MAG: hypothetical protein PVG50_04135 [Thiohalophilus sp.]|jgi:hypothetical protein